MPTEQMDVRIRRERVGDLAGRAIMLAAAIGVLSGIARLFGLL